MGLKGKTSLGIFFIILDLLFFVTLTTANLHHTSTHTTLYSSGSCPMDTLKLGICANVLKNLLGLEIGNPPPKPCCSLIDGLLDLEAALCLCTALKANVLGIINLNIPLSLELLLNVCQKDVPKDFQCP